MAKKSLRAVYLDPQPMSFTTYLAWSVVWSFYGASCTAYIVLEGMAGIITGLLLLIPVPALVWVAFRLTKRDRRVGVKPLGTA